MNSEWTESTLGELIRLQRGHDLTASEQLAGNIPVMGSAGQNGWHNQAKAIGPGVVIGRSGASMGRIHYCPVDFWPHNTCLYVTDFMGNNPQYVYYFLKTLDLDAYNSGSAQASLNRNLIYSIPLLKPTRSIQDGIAETIGLLDERIAVLQKNKATLEAIAKALFKSWFVDFDPVHANSGSQSSSLPPQIQALFPATFIDTTQGSIPQGWTVGCINDICTTITNGSTPSRSKTIFWEAGVIPWFKTGELADGFLLDASEKITELALAGSSVKLLPENSVLMAIYAAPTVGRLGVLTNSGTFNQACTGMVAKSDIGTWFLYWNLYFGREWFNSRANGAAQQNISKGIVESFQIVIPPKAVLDEFTQQADLIHKKIRVVSEQAQTLEKLRDTILPRLISGQLRLPEAEQAIAAITD